MTTQQVPRRVAISRAEFDLRLAAWCKVATPTATIGDTTSRGQKPWIHVRELGVIYYLNADTTRSAVEAYVGLLAVQPRLDWRVVENARGKVNKVAFGEAEAKLEGFYLYRDGPA